jgi:nucleoside phosphorylase
VGNEEITVGLVTALPVESAAVRKVVDGLERLPPTAGDRNHYHRGEIPSTVPDQPHRVVLGTLARDGNGNASALCTDLLRSFPTVRCVVLCGIAGGVPDLAKPAAHVRLGDIVVGESVVSYGHVRRVDGAEVLRRPADGISMDLARGDNELTIEAITGHRPWERWLADEGVFARPAAETDVLHLRGVPVAHPDPTLTGHPGGRPKVHHGPIGSADVLLRDETRRGELADRYKLLAFEMEASGLSSAAVLQGTHWFVVRGIADYGDNAGKNDVWHPYASLAAAAYVRELLAACHPFPVQSGAAEGRDDPPGQIRQSVSGSRIGGDVIQVAGDYRPPRR